MNHYTKYFSVQDFLTAQDKELQKDREKKLLELGIVKKVYSPDGKKTYEYDKCDYLNGEQRYYKEVALEVSDSEWLAIQERVKAISEIEEEEKAIYKQKEEERQRNLVKSILPNFVYKDDSLFGEEKEESGKSKIAKTLRIIAWIVGIIEFIGAIVLFKQLGILAIVGGVISIVPFMVICYAAAAALDYLARISATLQGGYKVTKTNK